ncbi:DUF6916 family protein [Sphingomonas hylomeconis]
MVEKIMTSPAPRPMFLAEFTPLVGRTLHADCDPRPVDLDLVEATPLRSTGQEHRPPFTLIFSSPPAILLLAGSYTMRGAGLEPAPIYISPIAAPMGSRAGHYYQAVFN